MTPIVLTTAQIAQVAEIKKTFGDKTRVFVNEKGEMFTEESYARLSVEYDNDKYREVTDEELKGEEKAPASDEVTYTAEELEALKAKYERLAGKKSGTMKPSTIVAKIAELESAAIEAIRAQLTAKEINFSEEDSIEVLTELLAASETPAQ
jgi:hypothetical protein